MVFRGPFAGLAIAAWIHFGALPAHAQTCAMVAAQPTSQLENPFFSRTAEPLGRSALQWHVLNILKAETSLVPKIAEIAAAKIQHFKSPTHNEPFGKKLRDLDAPARVQIAAEAALKFFSDGNFDKELRLELIRYLGVSLQSRLETFELLLPLARGLGFASLEELREVPKAITEISARAGSIHQRSEASKTKYEKAEDLLRQEPIASVEPLKGDHANATLKVTFKNGEKAIFKPRTGELSFHNKRGLERDIQFNREVSANTIVEQWLKNESARKKGRSRVYAPATVETVLVHDGKSYGVGSLQHFAEGFTPMDKFMGEQAAKWKEIRATKAWGETEARIRTMDVILGNHDRFPNNVHTWGRMSNLLIKITGPKSEDFLVAMIDNGLGRPGKPEFNAENVPLRNDIPGDLKNAIFALNWDDFRKAYSGVLPRYGIEDLLQRVQWVQSRVQNGP